LASTEDTWQGFLVRNGFLLQQIDPTIHLTQAVEELVSPKTLSHLLCDFRIEVQIQNDSVISPSDQTKVVSMTKMESKKQEFVSKKSLEEVLSHLRNESLNVVGHSQHPTLVVIGKFKGQGKQIREEVCDVDFKNKRSGRILSRKIRNKHK
jgi:hypothetical protein